MCSTNSSLHQINSNYPLVYVTGEQIEASLLSHSYEAMCVHRFIPRKNKEIKEIFWNPKNKIVSIV